MASFDLAGFMYNNAGNLGNTMNSSFGVRGSIFGMTSEEFRDMPSSVLRDLLDMMLDAKNKADAIVKEVEKKALIDAGQFEVDTEEGEFKLISDTSRYGLDRDNENMIGDLQALIEAIEGS